MIKTGSDILVMNGNNTYTGNTEIRAGELVANGHSVSHHIVGSGGKLTIGDSSSTIRLGSVTNQGTLEVNQANLQINGSLNNRNGNINQAIGTRINISGNADLTNSSLTLTGVKNGYVTRQGNTEVLLNAEQGISSAAGFAVRYGTQLGELINNSYNITGKQVSVTTSRQQIGDVLRDQAGYTGRDKTISILDGLLDKLDASKLGNSITYGYVMPTNDEPVAGAGIAQALLTSRALNKTVFGLSTETARHDLPETERLRENAPEDRRQKAYVPHNHKDCHCKVDARHEGDNQIQYLGSRMLPKHNHGSNRDQHDSRVERRNPERIFKGRGDRIADDLADAAPADQRRNRKENRDQVSLAAELGLGFDLRLGARALPDAALQEKVVDIVRRAAPVTAVERILFLVELGERRLDKGRRSADDCRDPHPEDRTGTARRDSRDHTDQIAHAHTRRSRDNERLHTREPSARGIGRVPALLLFQQHGNHLRKQAERQNARLYRIENTRRNQQQHHEREPDRTAARQRNPQQVAPQKLCHTLYDRNNRVHPHIPLFLTYFFALTR